MKLGKENDVIVVDNPLNHTTKTKPLKELKVDELTTLEIEKKLIELEKQVNIQNQVINSLIEILKTQLSKDELQLLYTTGGYKNND